MMPTTTTRRQLLARAGACAAAGLLPLRSLAGTPQPPPARARVVIARDEALTRGRIDEHRELLGRLLDAAMQKLTQAPDPAAAWRHFLRPGQRVGLKVNTLGLSTQPAVADAIVAGLRAAGVRAEQILIWDRFDVELQAAGFRLSRSGGVQCRGTDAERIGSGYAREIETSGRIGSCFSKIVTDDVDVLISVPVLKDHNLAGVSLGMKNFYGAIHNPNKYHDNNCDPYIVDVVSHPLIRRKWKLTVCDGTQAQCHGGPGRQPAFAWPFGGLILSGDIVAADAVAADLLEAERRRRGLKSLAEDNRPPRHIATAAARGLGEADPARIERIEV